jgi:Uma2 family endonuclease
MDHVVYDILSRRAFERLPRAVPPLKYRDGQVVQEGNGRVIYTGMILEEFLRLPEAKPALEYIDGRVVQKVSPKTKHSVLQAELGMYLRVYGRRQKLGRPYPELRCTFAGRSIVPDISFFARGRIPRDSSGEPVDDVFLPPDLMIKILSRGQTVKALSAKAAWCLAHGVRLCWVIQSSRKWVYVFRRDRPVEILQSGQTLSGSDVLPGFALPVDELFAWLLEE